MFRLRLGFAPLLGCMLALSLVRAGPVAAGVAFPVVVTVDAGQVTGKLPAAWRFFGADEPNYATMKDGQTLLGHLGALRPNAVYFRSHNLLTSGDGTPSFKWGSTNIYTEDAAGRAVYNWTIVDGIVDSYLARGVRPYLQIGFMPQALSSAPAGTRYRHVWRPGFSADALKGGWTAPPKDYDAWGELVYQWTLHMIARYGRAEVATWYFEVWNEADLPIYWTGTPEEFYKLHDYAIAAVRRGLPEARVGGPDMAIAGGAFFDGFLQHVVSGPNYATGGIGTPTDFVSFHAKGQPSFVDGHVRMGMDRQLRAFDTGFGKIAAIDALKAKPVIIGESDPEGCAACPGPQNGYRNGTMYASYEAASFARIYDLAARHDVKFEGALTWAFTFENQPWFAGYRQLATNGIDLPVLNVFRMFAQMGPERVKADSSGQVPLDAMLKGPTGQDDVGVLATRDGRRTAILLWYYNDDDVAGPEAQVHVDLAGLTDGMRQVTRYLVDPQTANAYAAWQGLGSPQVVDEAQYAVLEQASALKAMPQAPVVAKGGRATLDIALMRQGVTLLIVE